MESGRCVVPWHHLQNKIKAFAITIENPAMVMVPSPTQFHFCSTESTTKPTARQARQPETIFNEKHDADDHLPLNSIDDFVWQKRP